MQTGLVGQRERRSSEAKQASERPSAVLCNGSQKEISYLVLQRCCRVCCLVNQGQLICHTKCLCVIERKGRHLQMKVWLSLVARIHECNPFTQYCVCQNTDCTERTAALWFIFSFFLSLSGLRVEQEIVTSYPQVAVVRVPTPWVQSDSDITVLRHLEKMGCRLVNRPQAILNCVNKFWTFQELAGHGVPLPDTYSYGERSSLCLKRANPQSAIKKKYIK